MKWLRARNLFLNCVAILIVSAAVNARGADEPVTTLDAFSVAANRVEVLDPFKVTADRIEDFGFDLSGPGNAKGQPPAWIVHFVVPNTAAARAGLRPGDRVLKLDGQPANFRVWREWADVRKKKRAAVAAGGNVTWTLEVEPAGQRETRTHTLTVPTRPPRWGSATWQPPVGRAPAVIQDDGPLAALARTVLDNGVWTKLGWPFVKTRQLPEFSGANAAPFLGYYWSIVDEAGGSHRIFVSQSRGRTDVILSWRRKGGGDSFDYLSSPSGELEEAIASPRRHSLTGQKAADGFQQELEFWTKKVGPVSPRWPLELIPTKAGFAKPAAR